MNYYERYCGDYGRDTTHLSLAHHGAYTVLLDVQYSTEAGLPGPYDELYRICRAMRKPEQDAVRAVADQYFPIGDDGLRWNPRARREIVKAQPKIAASRVNGALGGRPKKVNGKPSGFLAGTQQKPDSNPRETQPGEASPNTTPQTPAPSKPKPGEATPLSGMPDRAGQVHRIFEHWRKVLGHQSAKLDEKRRKVVRQRLVEGYTVEQLCAAIDGCAKSAWHMGENDRGRRFDDLELICRDAKHVDDFLRTTEPSGLSGAGRMTAEAGKRWAEREEERDATR